MTAEIEIGNGAREIGTALIERRYKGALESENVSRFSVIPGAAPAAR